MCRGLPRTSQSEGVFDSTLVATLSYNMRRLANPDNLATTLRPSRMDGRGPRGGPARVTTLLEEVIAPRPTADGASDYIC